VGVYLQFNLLIPLAWNSRIYPAPVLDNRKFYLSKLELGLFVKYLVFLSLSAFLFRPRFLATKNSGRKIKKPLKGSSGYKLLTQIKKLRFPLE